MAEGYWMQEVAMSSGLVHFSTEQPNLLERPCLLEVPFEGEPTELV